MYNLITKDNWIDAANDAGGSADVTELETLYDSRGYDADSWTKE